MSIAMLDTFLPGSLPSALQSVGFGSTDVTLLFGPANFGVNAIPAGNFSVVGTLIGQYKLLTISMQNRPGTNSQGRFQFVNAIPIQYLPASTYSTPVNIISGSTFVTCELRITTLGAFTISTTNVLPTTSNYNFNITILYL